MAPRTSQLQIRVSPDQKAALKRLAAQAGLSVSAYVLGQALPVVSRALEGALDDVRSGKPGALPVLRRQIEAIPPEELATRWESLDASDLTPLQQNQVAALVEEVAGRSGVMPPRWTATIHPLEHPHFRWPLRSLRPYQLRASPVSLKRRNVFDTSEGAGPGARPTGTRSYLPPPLQLLHQRLDALELDIEFYFVGYAILRQTFPAHPPSARPRTMFADEAPVLSALDEIRLAEGWADTWLEAALREATRRNDPRQGYLDLPRLKAFTPPLGYALAMKVAAGELGGDRRADHVRLLLRAMHLSTPDEAMTVVRRYFAERQLPGDSRQLLADLFVS